MHSHGKIFSKRNASPSQLYSRLRATFLQTKLEESIKSHVYTGSGTQIDPYIIDCLKTDPQDAMGFPKGRKWAIAILQSLSTFCVTFASSVYVSGIPGVEKEFNVSSEVAVLGLCLFVLGFALAPLI